MSRWDWAFFVAVSAVVVATPPLLWALMVTS